MAGQCYYDAYQIFFIHQNEGAVLVHGYPRLTKGKHRGKKFGHAWVEIGEDVIDGKTPNLKIPKALYYAVGQIKEEECSKFNWDEVLDNSLDFEHYGPWGSVPADAIFA